MAKSIGKYAAAQEELTSIMANQQTVSVKKLSRLLQTMNISIKPGKTPEIAEVAYLKGEIKKRDLEIKRLKQTNNSN